MTRSIVACVEDLFFRSKIEATGRHLNVPIRFTEPKNLGRAAGEEGTAAVLLELSTNGEGFLLVVSGFVGNGQLLRFDDGTMKFTQTSTP